MTGLKRANGLKDEEEDGEEERGTHGEEDGGEGWGIEQGRGPWPM